MTITRTLLSTVVSAVLVLAIACAPQRAPTDGTAEPAGGQPVPREDPESVDELGPEPDGEEPAEVPAGAEPARLVWVAVEGDDRVVMVDLDHGEIVEDVATPGGPHNITVGADGTVAAALYATTDLAIVADGQVDIVTLGDRPHDVKATDDRFVVANEAGRRLELVSFDGEPGPTIELAGEPHDLAIDLDGAAAWVTLNRSDELAVVDLATATVDRHVATGHAPHDLLFAPDGRLWVTDWAGLLLVLDGDDVVHRTELGVEAHHLAFTPDGREAWITDHGTDELFVLDADTLEVLDVIALPGAPHHVAITADGTRAAVADHTNGQVLVFDVATKQQLEAVEVGPGPHGVWAVPRP